MTKNVLVVGKVRLSINETGVALFEPQDETRASIETIVTGYRDFIDRWLEASEEDRPRYISEEERELRSKLKRLGKNLKPLDFPRDLVETIIAEAAKVAGQKSPSLSQNQIDDSVTDAISSL